MASLKAKWEMDDWNRDVASMMRYINFYNIHKNNKFGALAHVEEWAIDLIQRQKSTLAKKQLTKMWENKG